MTPVPTESPKSVSLIGVPTDVGAGTLGARMGPDALRVAGIAQAIARVGLDVRDCGNLAGPANPCQEAVNGFRHLSEVVRWNQLLHDAKRRCRIRCPHCYIRSARFTGNATNSVLLRDNGF